MNTIDGCKVRWMVRVFTENLNIHFNHGAAHAPVASESSLIVMISIIVTHALHFKHVDTKEYVSQLFAGA